MAQFYKELKDLRISKEISLEDLESKTKINIKYLSAIEQGDFDILPTPYLRLFIRAYALEIGGDAERALEQLDSFVGNKKRHSAPSALKNIDKDENKVDEDFSFFNLLSDSNLKLRNDILKVSLLSILFIFSISIADNEKQKMCQSTFQKTVTTIILNFYLICKRGFYYNKLLK